MSLKQLFAGDICAVLSALSDEYETLDVSLKQQFAETIIPLINILSMSWGEPDYFMDECMTCLRRIYGQGIPTPFITAIRHVANNFM